MYADVIANLRLRWRAGAVTAVEEVVVEEAMLVVEEEEEVVVVAAQQAPSDSLRRTAGLLPMLLQRRNP